MFKDLAREQKQTTGRVNISELFRETGFDRKIVRHYLSQGIPPETSRPRNKPSKLDPYKSHIKGRLEKYPRLSRVRFFEEIQKQGYDGKPTILGDYLRQICPRILALPDIRYETLPGEMIQIIPGSGENLTPIDTSYHTISINSIQLHYLEYSDKPRIISNMNRIDPN